MLRNSQSLIKASDVSGEDALWRSTLASARRYRELAHAQGCCRATRCHRRKVHALCLCRDSILSMPHVSGQEGPCTPSLGKSEGFIPDMSLQNSRLLVHYGIVTSCLPLSLKLSLVRQRHGLALLVCVQAPLLKCSRSFCTELLLCKTSTAKLSCNVRAESEDQKRNPEAGMKYDEPEAAVLLVACAIGLATGAVQLLHLTFLTSCLQTHAMLHPAEHECEQSLAL